MKTTSIVLYFAFIISVTAKAQPAFTSAGEVRVSERPASGAPSIALQKDGSVLVTWPDAAQWLDANLNLIGNNKYGFACGILPVALPNNRWGMVRDTTVYYGSAQENHDHSYRYWLFDGIQVQEPLNGNQ